MAYEYMNSKGQKYYLHSRQVRLRSGRDQIIYFFARNVGEGALDAVPEGFQIVENKRTGLPVLKRV
ncbi:MAG: hypothetical protein C4584_00400 [Armatimonadetes bacterium]|nr:MAG: hypothetical protein C4584_00400 [Armatimonadota bacterium]